MAEVIVTLHEGADAAAIETALEGMGYKPGQRLGELGMLTGHADDALAERLRGVPGVAAVEGSQPIQLAPPNEGLPE